MDEGAVEDFFRGVGVVEGLGEAGQGVDQEDHVFAGLGAAHGLGEGVAGVARLAGGDDLGLGRLALPVGQLLGAGVDQQGDRVGALGVAGELAGDVAQQRGAGGAALAVDERLAAGRRQQQVV